MKYKEYDKETLTNLHTVQLEILEEIIRICKENNINYFFVGGTLLGAIRHNGFIPWDDDIDLGMLRKDYDKFIQIASKNLDKKYYLDCYECNKNYYLPFLKIKKNNTLFDEEESHLLKNHKGIFIDIFPFDNIKNPNSILLKIRAILIRTIIETNFYKYKIRNLKHCRHPFLTFILSIFTRKQLMNFQKYLMTKDRETEYVCCFAGSYPYQKEILKKEDIFPTKEIKFEGNIYQGMNNSHKYLSGIYGDYMKLPPIDKRVNHMPLKIEFNEKEEL